MLVMTKKKALAVVLLCAAALLGLILLCMLLSGENDLRRPEGRQHYLEKLGWEIDPDSEAHRSILLPERLDGALAEYDRLQREQGFDLSRHLGERCEQYTYTLLNYPDDTQTAMVTLYLQGRRLIAADIHSVALDGFMHGLRPRGQQAGEG